MVRYAADAMVAEGSVRVNESLITGEADEIVKYKGDKLYSEAMLYRGNARLFLKMSDLIHMLQSWRLRQRLQGRDSRQR